MGRALLGIETTRTGYRKGLSKVKRKKTRFGHFLNRVTKPFAPQVDYPRYAR
jgi:hypothetical protein